MNWRDWNPFALNENMTITDAVATMPSSPIKKIPFFVWLFENPASPFRLAGAADLLEHDICHVILGRGLLLQDEAFVIGFMMGNALDSSGWDRLIYRVVGQLIYRKPFRFHENDFRAFDFAFDVGQAMAEKNLFTREVRDLVDFSIGEVRKAMGLERTQLCHYYSDEVLLLPHTKVSARLTWNIGHNASELEAV